VYADDVNMLGAILHTIRKNTKWLSIVSKEVVQDVNGNKTKYFVISRDPDSERNYNIKIDTNCLESLEVFQISKKLRVD
jgi:prephenate dehydratase